MKAEILKARVNSIVGCLLVGSFAALMAKMIWQAANSLPYGILPGGL